MSIVKRKTDHLNVITQHCAQSTQTTGLEKYKFEHIALPEMDFKEIDTSTEFLSKKISMPLMIASMTGGIQDARNINMALAELAHDFHLPIALGSLRVLIEHPETLDTFNIRKRVPNTLLLANLGAVQLNYGFSENECQKIVDLVEADALILHLNPLHEVFQINGNTNFSNLFTKIEKICKKLDRPVIVKEVGFGISPEIIAKFKDIGVYAVDVACAGGTSWTEVESHLTHDAVIKNAAHSFLNWGNSLDKTLINARYLKYKLIASSGIKNGIDIAKCIALGAHTCAMAYQILNHLIEKKDEKLTVSRTKCEQFLEQTLLELKATMFCTGAKNIQQLSNIKLQNA